MTVQQYITNHPKSTLAIKLKAKFGAKSRKEIHIGSGLLNDIHNKNSNIYKLLKSTGSNAYISGGHMWRGTEGWIFAVFKK